MRKLGLKLWSINTDFYLKEAAKLFQQGIYGYIELYVVPNTLDNIEKWKKIKDDFNIPFALHAPHFISGMNLAQKERFEMNKKAYEELEEYRQKLNSIFTVVHGGNDGDIEETIRQLKIIQPKDMLIENKPYCSPLVENSYCIGYSIEGISKIMQETNCGFCLDIGHCICSANSHNIEPFGYIEKFNKLNPTCYHLSDGDIKSEKDKHLNFGLGNYDIKRIFDIIDSRKPVAIETNKSSKENLEDFVKDVDFINKTLRSL